MRLKITLTLLAILLGLLTYIFYIDTRIEDTQFAAERRSVLGELAVGIDYLSIHNSSTGQRITFEQQDNDWVLTEPYVWPANEFAVQSILTQLRFLERVTSFDTEAVSSAGASLDDYGLAPPELSLRFGRGDQRYSLGIGKATEIGNNLYVLSLDESRVDVVDRSLLDSLSVDLDQLRDPRLFETAVFEATSWNIQVRENNRNLRARFSRNGDKWIFETPIRARADTAAVNTLLNRSLNLEANSIVAANPSDLSPYGLQNSLYRIAVESGQQREVLEIGNLVSADESIRYAKLEDRPTVFQLRIDFLDLLANAQTKLRQRRIFESDVTAATTVTIERREEAPLTLQKLETGAWEIVVRGQRQGLQTLKGDTKTVEEILVWLNELKAVPDTGFVNDAPSAPDLESYGLEVPEFSITVTSNKLHDKPEPLESAISETLQIGDRNPEDRDERFVKIDSKDFVYLVYNDVFERITNEPHLYKNRQVIELSEGARITQIRIQRIDDDSEVAAFTFGGEPAASAEAQSLARAISDLTVDSYIPEGFTSTVEVAGRIQPWTYKVAAHVRRNGNGDSSDRVITLYVSETTGGPLLVGGMLERDLKFEFGQEFIDAFSKIVFDRQARQRPEEPFSTRPLPQTETDTEPTDQSNAAPEPEAPVSTPAEPESITPESAAEPEQDAPTTDAPSNEEVPATEEPAEELPPIGAPLDESSEELSPPTRPDESASEEGADANERSETEAEPEPAEEDASAEPEAFPPTEPIPASE